VRLNTIHDHPISRRAYLEDSRRAVPGGPRRGLDSPPPGSRRSAFHDGREDLRSDASSIGVVAVARFRTWRIPPEANGHALRN
jgi:hypothetical protein